MIAATDETPIADSSQLGLALAERLFRIAAMLRFEAQAVGEVRYGHRAHLVPEEGETIAYERLDQKLGRAEARLRSLSVRMENLGVKLDEDKPRGRALERPAPHMLIADAFLGRVASAAHGLEDERP